MAQAMPSWSVIRLVRWLVAAALLSGGVALPAMAAAAGPAGHVPPSAQKTSSCGSGCLARDLRADLAAYLRAHGSAEHISAAGLSVRAPRHHGNIDVASGTMRVGGARHVRSSDVWQIGSNTKAFTSVMLLQLEAAHRLSLEDTVGMWLPRYRQWRHVTIKRLLDMTSGIPSYDNTPAFLRAFVADPHRYFSARDLVSYAAKGEPTHGYSYSNTNYVLAEMIIEKVTHDSYAHQLRRRIIRPLGLRDMFYRADRYPSRITQREPAGYFFNTDLPILSPLLGHDVSRTTLSWTRGAGGIISTTHDMTVWENALYHGRLLPARQQRELSSLVSTATGKPIRRTTPREPEGFALGIAQLFDPTLGRVWFYEGETLGFRTLHVYLPASGVIFAVALNSQPTVDGIGDLVGSVYGTLAAHGLVTTESRPGPGLQAHMMN